MVPFYLGSWQLLNHILHTTSRNRDARFGLKVCQIGIKWVKASTFQDQISVHFGSPSQNVLKYDLEKSQICPRWGQYDQIWIPNLTPLKQTLSSWRLGGQIWYVKRQQGCQNCSLSQMYRKWIWTSPKCVLFWATHDLIWGQLCHDGVWNVSFHVLDLTVNKNESHSRKVAVTKMFSALPVSALDETCIRGAL